MAFNHCRFNSRKKRIFTKLNYKVKITKNLLNKMTNRLVIINNESISNNNQHFHCDNIDSKSLSEGLNKNFNVLMIGRQSKIQRSHQINLKQIIAASNILVFLYNVLKTFKNKYLCGYTLVKNSKKSGRRKIFPSAACKFFVLN